MTTLASSVKINFENLLKLRNDIEKTFLLIEEKLSFLKNLYSEIVKTHSHKEYIFGIDSLYFQNKLIENDYSNLKNTLILIDNRVYCEYYSLYNMIKSYGASEFNDNNVKKSVNFNMVFEPYKHLNKDKIYDIVKVKEIHAAIFACINELDTYLTTREYELERDKEHSSQGLNIDNLVHSEIYRNTLMRAKLDMFFKYLQVFHNHHYKYYTRLLAKGNMHLMVVTEDIILKQYEKPPVKDVKLQKSKEREKEFDIKIKNYENVKMDISDRKKLLNSIEKYKKKEELEEWRNVD